MSLTGLSLQELLVLHCCVVPFWGVRLFICAYSPKKAAQTREPPWRLGGLAGLSRAYMVQHRGLTKKQKKNIIKYTWAFK